MKIGKLAACLPGAVLQGDPEVDITGIAYDSRQVRPGICLFASKVFVLTATHFVHDAVNKGAAAVVIEAGRLCEGLSVPVIHAADTRLALGASQCLLL